MAPDVKDMIEDIMRSLSCLGVEPLFIPELQNGATFYRSLLHALTHLDFSEEEAHDHWKRISAHRVEMSRKMNRPVSFRVAMIDYFLEINRKIENPKIIETKMFESIERLINIDPLTGLYNRRFLDQALKREISLAKRNKIPFSIILIDLDFFKIYNDTHGHLDGDDALRMVARHLRETLRAEDLAVRYGGEEFLVILPRASRSGALAIGERLRKRIASFDPKEPGLNLKSPITISAGIATFPQDGNDEKQLLFSVDRALYQAKSEGRNTICICAPDRRRFIRIDFICPIQYQVIRPEARAAYAATTRNLGEGGILFAVQQEIPLRAIVKVEINVPESNRTADLVGEIVRVEKGVLPDEPYLVGLSFLQFEGGEQNPIIEYIKEKIKIE